MRNSFVRNMSAVLMCSALAIPVSLPGQSQNPTKHSRSSSQTATESTLLTAEDGPARRVDGDAPKGRLAPGLPPAAAPGGSSNQAPVFRVLSHPREGRLRRGHGFDGDLRTLPQVPPEKFERPEFEEPKTTPRPFPGTASPAAQGSTIGTTAPIASAPAPSPILSFEGLDFANWGAGHPPDTNGDVGPQYYIQTINTSVGIYSKSDGTRVTAITFNTLMSQGNFGNLCDTANFGDPVVVYDTFEDRWIITDFAFSLSGGNPVAPDFQCFAVSKSGDPVSGGWNFYSIQVSGGLGDYPKVGVWLDGLYMSANIFGFGAGGSFQNVRVWALNKAQMYAGETSVQVLSFDAPPAEFTLLPSNARLQTGTPPPGSPNYFAVVAQFLNAVSIYKLHADWNNISTSTFSGPFQSLAATSWSQLLVANQSEQSPGNKLDTLYFRLMLQNQYTNIGGTESLWNSHTVGASGTTSAQAAPRFYQVNVTGGTVAALVTQAFTYSPDATVFRFMPSMAVDRAGDMAIGYSATNATLNPAIRYAGRLSGDPANSITQSETSLIEGTGTQSGNCGSTCTRWGDYSGMTLDPDGCTFWYTNMYYRTTGLAFNTRIGAFSFPSCTPVGSGTLQGTVTATIGGAPIQGASVTLGSRTATTDINGNYTFTGLPAGTYPSITASFAGYTSSTVQSLAVNDGTVTTQDFSLPLAQTSGCLIDTTQADFQAGIITNCDLTSGPGDITLLNAPNIDQQNTTLGTSGVGITITTWGGQTFTPSVTGQLTRVDINLFCSGCTGTTPNLTVSLRATSGGLPTGADLASATISGFSNGAAVFYTGTFTSPPTVTAGTMYALVIRPTANPSPGTYALTRSGTSTAGANVYSGGTRVSGATSGTVWSIPLTGGVSTDAGFKVFLSSGFASSGTFVSSAKDANPDPNSSATWGILSWTADTPTGTNIQFQAAANNDASGTFNFVGPDGTAATLFSNGDSLAQFNGKRYLKYEASFTTNSSTSSPTLHDVTVCFNNVANAVGTSLAVAPASAPYGGSANLSATLTANSAGVSGKTVSFTLNGNSVGTGTTDDTGIAALSNASAVGISPGSYPTGIGATFAGDSSYTASSGTASLTVSQSGQTITFGPLSDKNFGDPDFTISATASSGLTVTFSAAGNCTVTGSAVHLTGAGSCTITASQAGDSNYNPATDVPQLFTIAKGSQTVTFAPLSGKNFGDPDFAVSATATSGLTVSFSASGSCSVTGSTVHLTGAGNCTITALQTGDSNYSPAPSVPQSFAIAKGSQAITFGALSSRVFGNPDFAVSATATSGLTVSFSASGSCSVTGSIVHLTGAGNCTITALQTGDSNYSPAPSVPQSFAISKDVPVVTVLCPAAGFDGDSHGCSATAAGVGNATVAGSSTFTYSGNSSTPMRAGTYAVSASFSSGDSNYADAAGSGSLLISKATPTVAVACPGGIVYDGNVHSCTAAASGVGGATVSGSVVVTYNDGTAPVSGGIYAVSASFTSGDSNYGDSIGVGSLTIARAPQTITFAALPGKTLGDPDFTVSATATSGLPISFSASGNCSITGATVHLTVAGSCTVTALQPGNGNYNPATSVARSFAIGAGGDFTIAAKLPTITVTAGQQATDNITVTPNPSTLTSLSLTCSGLPAQSTCTFTPSQVLPGSIPTTVVMTINTTASGRAAISGSRLLFASWINFSGMGLIGLVFVGARKKNHLKVAMGILALMFLLVSLGCGSGLPRTLGTPAGTSTVTVTAATTNFTHSTTIRLTVN